MLTNSRQKLFKKDISLKMLLELFILSSVFGPAQPLVLGGQPLGMNDSQYLHLLLADEKQARMQLQNHVNSLETTITDLQDRLAELEETGPCAHTCQKPAVVAFMAQLSSSVTPVKGQIVVFDKVETNEGNAYNSTSGVFVAPHTGTYNFNVIGSSPPAAGIHHLHLFIMRNQSQVGYVFLDDNDHYWIRRSTDVTIHVRQGDEVYVKVDAGDFVGSQAIGGCCFHSHFSGFLVGLD